METTGLVSQPLLTTIKKIEIHEKGCGEKSCWAKVKTCTAETRDGLPKTQSQFSTLLFTGYLYFFLKDTIKVTR